MKTFFKLVLLSSILCIYSCCFSQTKVNESKAELSSDSKSNNSNSSKVNSTDKSDKYESLGNNILSGIFEGIFRFTSNLVIGDYENEPSLHSPLTRYPYDNNCFGNYENDSLIKQHNRGRIDLENKFLYNNPYLTGNHLKAKIRPFQYLYIQGDYFQITAYNKTYKGYDNLPLFNINLGYDRVRTDYLNVGWTLGMNYAGSNVRRAGFSFGINADAFIFRNVSLSGSARWSYINSQPVNESEINCRYHLKRYFFTVGYEHLKIASPIYNYAGMGAGIYL